MTEIVLETLFYVCILFGLGIAWVIYCIAVDWKRQLDADPTLTDLRRGEDD